MLPIIATEKVRADFLLESDTPELVDGYVRGSKDREREK
jgi:hypothetical protein